MILRILHFSPGTATGRYDSYRAALAFTWLARQAVQESELSIQVDLRWALPSVGSKAEVHAMMTEADLLVIATPTYAQGSPWFVRRFLELCAGLQLWGRLGTAFASAGGQHTGGETAVSDTLRSMMGLGMLTFTFAQKLVVFGAQQKSIADGTFEAADLWFLQQLARTCVANLAGFGRPSTMARHVARWGLNTSYYLNYPSPERMNEMVGNLLPRINEPLMNPLEYRWWSDQLGFDASPPDPRRLPFFDLLPLPQAPVAP